jgi:hypothetical protein
MIFLDKQFLIANMKDVENAYPIDLNGKCSLKARFGKAVRALQDTPFHSEFTDNSMTFEWDNVEMVKFLRKHKLIPSQDQVPEWMIPPGAERSDIAAKAKEAMFLLEQADPDLADLVNTIIATLGFLYTPTAEGGSVSAAIGYIYLSPKPYWTTAFFAEMLVHETVHNMLFLADMVHGLFPDLSVLDNPDALVLSAIREQRRPFDKSFHSACVSATLIRYNQRIGDTGRAIWLSERLVPTVKELTEVLERCNAKHLNLTTELGAYIVSELRIAAGVEEMVA